MIKTLLIYLLLTLSLFANSQVVDDAGFIDNITINDREFDSLEQETIEFYAEDLIDGKVIVQGLLESQIKELNVSELFVEVSIDGGYSWQRATGHKEWEYSFEPKLNQTYQFSLRITKDIATPQEQEEDHLRQFTIGGFVLTLSEDAQITANQISGSGTISLPYLERFSINGDLNVDFENLTFDGDTITAGEIRYNQTINFSTLNANVTISDMLFRADSANNQIHGHASLNGFLSAMPTLDFADSSKVLPTKLSIDVTVAEQTINIWAEKNVQLNIASGEINIAYTLGDEHPSFNLDRLNATLNFGDVLTDAQGSHNGIQVELNALHTSNAYLLGKNIRLNDLGFELNIDDPNNPIITFTSAIDFSNYNNPILRNLQGATITAEISRRGFLSTVRASRALDAITILDRGSDTQDVRVIFNQEMLPEFSIEIADDDITPMINLSGLNAQLSFGDVLQTSQREVGAIIKPVITDIEFNADTLSNFSLRFVNLPQAYLLGDKVALEGLNATFDLDTLTIEIESSVNLSKYNNPILQALSGSLLSATITRDSLSASIEMDGGIEPITILDRGGVGRDVRVSIDGNPSVALTINDTNVEFSFGELDATVDFGDLIQTTNNGIGGAVNSATASISGVSSDTNSYLLNFRDNATKYLLGGNFGLNSLTASINLNTKTIELESVVALKDSKDIMLQTLDGATLNALISPSAFSGSITSDRVLDPITILDRGSQESDVRLQFTAAPQVGISIVRNDLSFNFNGGEAQLFFGDLLEGAVATLHPESDGVYAWSIRDSKRVIDTQELVFNNLSGVLDISDSNNPFTTLEANVNLSGYGGIFSSINNVNLSDGLISKEGFRGTINANLGEIKVFPQKRVALRFTDTLSLNLSIDKNNFNMGFEEINLDIYFGDLLQNAVAHVGRASSALKLIGDKVESNLPIHSRVQNNFTWFISGQKRLDTSNILLSQLSGTLDFSDIANPSITLNANADMHRYSNIFRTLRSANIEDATISKAGFSATLTTELETLNIWRDKNVRLVFDEDNPPEFNIQVTSSKFKVGINNFQGDLEFGDLLNGATAHISTGSDAIHSWSLNGSHNIQDSQVVLREISGALNLNDLKNPIINLNATANLSNFSEMFAGINSATLENSTISKQGFSGELSVNLDDINIWASKDVKVVFPDGESPTLNFLITRDDFKFGLSNINANINFGQLLDGEVVTLQAIEHSANDATNRFRHFRRKFTESADVSLPPLDCIYNWNLQNSHQLIHDDNGVVTVGHIGGTMDFCDLNDPVIVFDANADFRDYNYHNLDLSDVNISDGRISKDGIDWNLDITGAGGKFTILDMQTGDDNDNVRVEFLADLSASSSGHAEVDAVAGTLFFGVLFDGDVEDINISYTGEDGVYSFSSDQELSFGRGEHSISFNGIRGQVRHVRDTYQVTIDTSAQIQSTIISDIGIDALRCDNLTIDSEGFRGDITADLDGESHNLIADKVAMRIDTISIRLDSKADTPLKLLVFSGKLDFGEVFDEDGAQAQANFSYRNSDDANPLIEWSLANELHINNKFIFKNLSGSFDPTHIIDEINFSGTFGIDGVDSEDDFDIAFDNFRINSGGLSGAVTLENGHIRIFNNLHITELDTQFVSNRVRYGHIGLTYDKDRFIGNQNLSLALEATIDNHGISEFTMNTDSDYTINIANFANMTFSNIGFSVNPRSLRDSSFTLNGLIKPTNSTLKADNSLEFEGLKISSSGVSIESAYAEFDISGSGADLGGLTLNLDRLGIGFREQVFYLRAVGSLALDIAEAGAGVKIFSDGRKPEIDQISVQVNIANLTCGGSLKWYDDTDPENPENSGPMGKGFGTVEENPIHLSIAGAFSVSGEFKIGKKYDHKYWVAKAQGMVGSAIVLGPVSIYEIGGGIAKNLALTPTEPGGMEYQLTPTQEPQNATVIVSALVGTTDVGFTWHAQVDAYIDTESKQLFIEGNSYLLSSLRSTPQNRKIYLVANISGDSLHIYSNVNISYASIGLHGDIDILLSDSEQHYFIGTHPDISGFNVDNELGDITLDIFGLHPNGYFMMDSHRIALGLNMSIDEVWEKDLEVTKAWAKIDAGVDASGLFIYKPFFMKINGNVWFFASAGFGKYEEGKKGLFSGGVDLAFEMATPNPTYLWGKVTIQITQKKQLTFKSYIYGKGGRESLAERDTQNALISDIKPDDGASEVSIFPHFKIMGNYEFNDNLTIMNISLNASNGTSVGLENLSKDGYESVYVPREVLSANTTYTLQGTLRFTDPESGNVKTEEFERTFTTTAESKLRFDEIITRVTPENFQEGVRSNQAITLYYNEIVNRLPDANNNPLILNYAVDVTNAKGESVEGIFTPNIENLKSEFVPSEPLRVYHFCKNEDTGEVRETWIEDGEYYNPFLDNEESNNRESSNRASSRAMNSLTFSPIQNRPAAISSLNLGNFVFSTGNYSFYSNDKYNITITDATNNQIVYFSSFTMVSERSVDEDRLMFDTLKENLAPVTTYHPIVQYIGTRSASHTDANLDADDGCISNKIDIDVNRGFSGIGMRSNGGITTELRSLVFRIKNEDGRYATRTYSRGLNFTLDEGEKFCSLLSAELHYFDDGVNVHFSDTEVREGEIDEEILPDEERIEHAVEQGSQYNPDLQDITVDNTHMETRDLRRQMTGGGYQDAAVNSAATNQAAGAASQAIQR